MAESDGLSPKFSCIPIIPSFIGSQNYRPVIGIRYFGICTSLISPADTELVKEFGSIKLIDEL